MHGSRMGHSDEPHLESLGTSADERTAACRSIEPLLALYHDEQLASDQMEQVRAHIAGCAYCRRRLESYTHLDHLLRATPTARPDSRVRERVYARIAAEAKRPRRLRPLRGIQAHARPTATHQPLARSPRPLSVVMTTTAALSIAALLALIFATHVPASQPNRALSSPSFNTQSPALAAKLQDVPHFSDWRPAYLGSDGRLLITSLDGSATVAGPLLQHAQAIAQTNLALPYMNAAASPDGYSIAYIEDGDMNTGAPVQLVNLVEGTSRSIRVSVRNLFWSPDSSQIAANVDGIGGNTVTLINAHDGHASAVTALYAGGAARVERIVGWIDATHLGVLFDSPLARAFAAPSSPLLSTSPSGGVAALLLGSLDLANGSLRKITPVPQPADVVLTPDGQEALILSSWWNTIAEVVTLPTGDVHSAPEITQTFATKLQHVDNANFAQGGNWSLHLAWRPGRHVVAISLAASGGVADESGSIANQQPGIWLLDVDHDRATQLTTNTYPLAWTPDGTTLITCDPPSPTSRPLAGAGVGPGLYALTPAAPGGRETLLTKLMVAFFGLVRTH